MFGVVSLDVYILDMVDTSSIVFIDRCKDVNHGRESTSASNMLNNDSQPESLMSTLDVMKDIFNTILVSHVCYNLPKD